MLALSVRREKRGACSAVGSAPEWHSGGHRFDPGQVHQISSVVCNVTATGAASGARFRFSMRWILDALDWFNAQPDGSRMIIGGMAAATSSIAVVVGRWFLRRRRFDERAGQWRETEERFNQIDGEIDGVRKTYDSGLIEWNLSPKYESFLQTRRLPLPGEGDRRVQRFKSEATASARLWQRQHRPATMPTDPVGMWLDVVASKVHNAAKIAGGASGTDERGHYKTFHIDRLVDASKVICVALAAEAENAKPRRWFR
jgi:hypothetical protein